LPNNHSYKPHISSPKIRVKTPTGIVLDIVNKLSASIAQITIRIFCEFWFLFHSHTRIGTRLTLYRNLKHLNRASLTRSTKKKQ
jgi:hypothetical protein